jgi:hypothetical protein
MARAHSGGFWSAVGLPTADDKGKGTHVPFPLQRIAHWGACGKTPVGPQNRPPSPTNLELRQARSPIHGHDLNWKRMS